jgi:hypothetical protein
LAFPDKIIFIVGNSRSGTTMMLRILNNHQQLFVLNELHFFEQLWSPDDKGKTITQENAREIAAKLVMIQRKGYNTGFTDFTQYYDEADAVITSILNHEYTAEAVLTAMARREIALNNKQIVCEKTPQNVFYIKEIFELYPNAKVVNMVRDPRAILLSQKNKWNRKNLGGWYITRRESIRLQINYHPITLSKLWNAAINAAGLFKTDKRLISVRFEDLLENPEQTIRTICNHIEVDFDSNMMNITQESSSIEKDSMEIGFKKERASNWLKGGLNITERWICQTMCKDNMQQYGYPIENIKPNIFYLLYFYISFPVKISLALLMNLDRMKNIAETLKRRMT